MNSLTENNQPACKRTPQEMQNELQHLLSRAIDAHQKGDLVSAEKGYREVLSRQPRNADANQNLGILAKQAGHLDAAQQLLGNALALESGRYVALLSLAEVFELKGELNKAVQAYQQVLKLKPELVEVYNNLGLLLKKMKRYDDALVCYRQAVRIRPTCAQALSNLGNALKESGRVEEAISVFRKSVSIKPPSLDAYSNLLLATNYSAELSSKEVFDLHAGYENIAAKQFSSERFDFDERESGVCNGGKLRIGYVSADLHQHSVAYFAEPLLRSHDKEQFEVVVYYSNTRRDKTNMKFRQYADTFRDVAKLSDNELAELIYKDNIDILVDLGGHSAANRLGVFVQKPAPVQVSWLGYPNTTGLSQIDYRITDKVADPVGNTEQLHSEALIRLDSGFLSFQPDDGLDDVTEAPCVRNKFVTFGSFNNLVKVTPEVVEVWAKILNQVENSRLVLKSNPLGDKAVCDRFLSQFESLGVDASRVELLGALPNREDHLALYSAIDVGLDPFPYNGTTTTCEALWMGVPTITLRGETHAARVGASLMSQVGLSDFVAEDIDQYVAKAAALADAPSEINALRQGMRLRMESSPLLDHVAFASQIESAYKEMWCSLSECNVPLTA